LSPDSSPILLDSDSDSDSLVKDSDLDSDSAIRKSSPLSSPHIAAMQYCLLTYLNIESLYLLLYFRITSGEATLDLLLM